MSISLDPVTEKALRCADQRERNGKWLHTPWSSHAVINPIFSMLHLPLVCPQCVALSHQGRNGEDFFDVLQGGRESGLVHFKQLVGVLIRANIGLIDLP